MMSSSFVVILQGFQDGAEMPLWTSPITRPSFVILFNRVAESGIEDAAENNRQPPADRNLCWLRIARSAIKKGHRAGDYRFSAPAAGGNAATATKLRTARYHSATGHSGFMRHRAAGKNFRQKRGPILEEGEKDDFLHPPLPLQGNPAEPLGH